MILLQSQRASQGYRRVGIKYFKLDSRLAWVLSTEVGGVPRRSPRAPPVCQSELIILIDLLVMFCNRDTEIASGGY